MKKTGVLFFLTMFLFSCGPDKTDPVLHELDDVLAQKETYLNYFHDRVAVLRSVLSDQTSPEQTYNINKRLADAYASHSLDTALVYLGRNRALAGRMGSVPKAMEVDFKLIDIYCLAGYYAEASEIMSRYAGRDIPSDLELAYFRTCRRYYGETMAYASNAASHQENMQMRDYYRTRLLEIVPEGTYEWYDLKREVAYEEGDMTLAAEYAYKMIEASVENSHDYAKACYLYHDTFAADDVQNRMFWLVKSAIADAMCSVRDYMSLITLSELLFRQGDVERAFRYAADHCMTDALHYNGRLRPWQISQFFPQIEKAYTGILHQQMEIMRNLILVILFVVAALFSLLLYIIKRNRILVSVQNELRESYAEIDNRNHELVEINLKLTDLNAQIQEADKIKQEYIALFLSILSENISTVRQYKNRVLKYIRQGNSKKIVDEIEALPSIDNDINEFYKMFDQTFVNLYPDFVHKFNALLVDGAAIVPKGDDILTPELRIFALIKLGITDSSKIASLLHYSANTIYNYRAKTKNKARCSRDEFEAAVRSIE